jgi:hypothetical protein
VTSATQERASSSAYGFRVTLAGIDGVLPDLPDASPDDDDVTVDLRLATGWQREWRVEDDRVLLATRSGNVFDVAREPRHLRLSMPMRPSLEALVHPVLTVPMSIFARWRGDVTLHGGAFHHGGAAWCVLGERTAGKSSMLGILGDFGVPILADDLVVITDGDVRAGPRCVDLRPDLAAQLPAARDLGMVGTRPRLRLATPPGPARSRLAGIFLLEWGDDEAPSVTPLTMAERLALLYRQEAIALLEFSDRGKVMDLVGLPMWRLSRRRDWRATPGARDLLLSTAADHAGR